MKPASKKRILIIDDDVVSREILNEALEPEEYTLATAAEGKEGVNLHKKNPFDLVISDIIMPGMEGLETIRELRRISPHIKIIAVSGGGHIDAEGYLKMADKLGADLTFGKPFKIPQIIDGVRRLLASS